MSWHMYRGRCRDRRTCLKTRMNMSSSYIVLYSHGLLTDATKYRSWFRAGLREPDGKTIAVEVIVVTMNLA